MPDRDAKQGRIAADQALLHSVGRARVELDVLRHTGRMFEVYDGVLAVGKERIPVCLKVAREEMASGSAMMWAYSEHVTGIYSWQGALERLDERVLARLLLSEARAIASVGRYWNHGVLGVGRWCVGGQLSDIQPAHADPSALLETDPHQLAVIMPRWAGQSLAQHPRARALFPRLVPALWHALSWHAHGDLKPGAVLMSADNRFFRILDPGVCLHMASPERPIRVSGDTWIEHVFTSNLEYYPFLLPQFGPAGAAVPRWLTKDNPLFPPAWPVRRASGDAPVAADRVALGLIYFKLLTGRTFQSHLQIEAPLWGGYIQHDGGTIRLNEADRQQVIEALADGLPEKILARHGCAPAERALCSLLLQEHVTLTEIYAASRAAVGASPRLSDEPGRAAAEAWRVLRGR